MSCRESKERPAKATDPDSVSVYYCGYNQKTVENLLYVVKLAGKKMEQRHLFIYQLMCQ